MDSTIAQRVGELDADSSEVAEDAQYALIAMGPEVLAELTAATPRLGSFGQLCAIEVFTALKDPRPGSALIDLLESENATVRQWAATALADLGIQRAVPALRRAYEAFRQRGEAPDDCEGTALRRALTDLGAREPVLPPRAAALRASPDILDQAWPTAHLAEGRSRHTGADPISERREPMAEEPRSAKALTRRVATAPGDDSARCAAHRRPTPRASTRTCLRGTWTMLPE
ncbi:HEAT repeat domain-containing protein [Kitasatospora purpeofusca]|uniref:HEAT repeat domain-containing protein n=1 Tax=Kitasatospora purpeofusca TaxID=67352 RepID=UPI0033E1C4F6